MSRRVLVLALATALLLSVPLWDGQAQPPSAEELEAWFHDDAEPGAAAVNEGELEFLAEPPAKRTLHSRNDYSISASSIEDGWVRLLQCHEQLDPVPAAAVLYRYHRMRGLRITSAQGIERAWVEGQSVELVNVTPTARLCVAAEVAVLYANPDGSFSLLNGPFHRKFLDGYFPMRVTLDVRYPDELLELVTTRPQPRRGVDLDAQPGRVMLDVWFVGELTTELRFQRRR